jgi:hypothetical protein
MSKAKLASDGISSPAPKPNARPAESSVFVSARCVIRTPLGRPVEPDV